MFSEETSVKKESLPCFSVVFWNIENMFNPETRGPRNDLGEEEGWKWSTFDRKALRLKNVLDNMPTGPRPGLIGLCEIDDRKSVERLFDIICSANYGFVYAEELETENLDTLLLYDKDVFEYSSHESMSILNRYPKADVLLVNLVEKNTGAKFLVSVNHWSSRYLGRDFTCPFRRTTAENLQAFIWKKLNIDPDLNIILIGDFNDDPFSSSMVNHLKGSHDKDAVINCESEKMKLLYNTSWEKLLCPKPGSIFHEKGNDISFWKIFDQILVSGTLLKNRGWTYRRYSFEIFQKIMTDELGRPFSCFSKDEEGNFLFLEAYSDHFPVYAFFDYSV